MLRTVGRGFSRSDLQDMRRFHEAFEICQTVSGKSMARLGSPRVQIRLIQKCQTPSGELEPRLVVDFENHFHLNWPHYRLLLGLPVGANEKEARHRTRESLTGGMVCGACTVGI